MKIKHLQILKMMSRIFTYGFILHLFLMEMLLAAPGHAQSARNIRDVHINFQQEKLDLIEVFEQIEGQSNFLFTYDSKDVKSTKINVGKSGKSLFELLEDISRQTHLFFRQTNYDIDVRRINRETQESRVEIVQTTVVSGNVTSSENQEGLPGVTILVKGSTNGTVTDVAGNYEIVVPADDAVLIFSFVGFLSQEIPVKNQTNIDVQLSPDVTALGEVVVVAYGVQKKQTMVGSQSSIKSVELQQPVANLSTAIAGRIAGIVGVQRSGEPGYDDAEIYIRGISSFVNSSSQPLILVDGVERSFNNIDPEDIESFNILKDASATALYGVRGGNGVILITTKKGKVSKPEISVQYNQGITQFTRLPEFADGVTYMQMANEARGNSSPGAPPVYSQGAIDSTMNRLDPDLYSNVNWFDEIFNETGQNRRLNFNISGGSEKATYYLSLGYYNEQGLFKNESLEQYASSIGYNRYNFTSNLSLNVTQSTKVDFGASGFISQGNYPGNATGNIFQDAYLLPPVVHPAQYSDGKFAQQRSGDIGNPYVALTQAGYVVETRGQIWSNIRVTQQLDKWLDGLSVTGMYSFDNTNTYRISRTKSVDRWLAVGRDDSGNLIYEGNAPIHLGSDVLGYSRDNGGQNQSYLEAAVNYGNTFGRNDVSAMLLYNQISRIDAFAGNFIASIPYRFHGLAGRATYAFDQRYMVEANFGYNGSEAFAPENRYGFFPSVGLGWIVSNEPFFEPVAKHLQFLKIRLSHGIVGNAVLSTDQRFAYLSTVADTDADYGFGRTQDRYFDALDIEFYGAQVRWETSTKSNLGLELGLFQDALSVTVDFFRNIRSDIYLERGDVPEYAGIRNNVTGNLGEIYNRGIDGTIEYRQHLTRNLQLGFRGNFTWTRSTVLDDANAEWPYPWQQRVGRKLGQRFGYIALGLFESDEEIANSPRQTGTVRPGDIKYKDLNSDGIIDGKDQAPIGFGSFPEIVYGFGPTITYKGWSLGAFFKGIGNVDIMLNDEGLVPFQQGVGSRGNLLSVITDRWTIENPNPNAFYPRLSDGVNNMNYVGSTWWQRNGSYLRLQNVELSYTFSENPVFEKIGLNNLRLYFLSYNIFTWSKFKLWDVELGDGRGSGYPLIKTYSFGIDCKF